MSNDFVPANGRQILEVFQSPADENKATAALNEVTAAFFVFSGINVAIGLYSRDVNVLFGAFAMAILALALRAYRSRTVSILLAVNAGGADSQGGVQ